jgi:ATP-dependent DNA helicase MPH1
VFLAPTKPLVTQQVTACHEAAGIPANATAQLLGNVKPSMRAELWASKR